MKDNKHKSTLKSILALLLLGLLMGAWGYVWMKFFAQEILRPFGYKGNWLMVAVYGIVLFLFSSFYGGYQIGHQGFEDLLLSNGLGLLFTNVVTYLQTSLVGRALLAPIPFVLMTLVQLLIILLWSKGATRLYNRLFPPYVMLLLYEGRSMAQGLVSKMSNAYNKYQIQEVMDVSDKSYAQVTATIDRYENIILCDIGSPQRNQYLKYCFGKNKRIYSTPKISDILMRTAWNYDLFDTPLLLNTDEVLTTEERFLKRAMDLVISTLGLLILSPFMLVVACIIKGTDGGPVFYKQERLTCQGETFVIYKFRSMVEDAEKETGAQLSTKEDPRITSIGRFLRATRMDELPQLWNIFKGEMSVVGPRPERPEIVEDYQKDMPEFKYRLKVKAGLTGYAQVYGKYNTTPYDKLKMDLLYISGYSLLLDIKIILLTFKTVFQKETVEGIDLESFPQSKSQGGEE